MVVGRGQRHGHLHQSVIDQGIEADPLIEVGKTAVPAHQHVEKHELAQAHPQAKLHRRYVVHPLRDQAAHTAQGRNGYFGIIVGMANAFGSRTGQVLRQKRRIGMTAVFVADRQVGQAHDLE